MDTIKKFLNNIIVRGGTIIAACAVVFVSLAANSACGMPFYEPEEPEGLAKFKKYN